MAERKVLNKYYPPDFDPSKLRRFEKKSVRKMCNVRMMLPMSMRCHTCGNYAYIGTKFNMKVETVKDEDYLGIKIYRFYFKCTQCYSEITFRTDPKNHDYIAEWGASRNHEPWKDMLMAEEEYKEMKQNEMKEDAMKSLEHRTYDSKREMDILDALDQVKSLNRRQAQVNFEDVIDKVIHKEQEKEAKDMEKDIEEEAHRIYERMKIRRIRDYSDIKLNEEEKDKDKEDYFDDSTGVSNINQSEFNGNFAGNNFDGINAIKKSENKTVGNLINKANKNISNYDSDEEEKIDGAVIFRKSNSGKHSNFKNESENIKNPNELIKQNAQSKQINIDNVNSNIEFLNKKRSFENEDESQIQAESNYSKDVLLQDNNYIENQVASAEENNNKNISFNGKKKSIFDNIENENEQSSSSDEDSIEKDFEKNKEIFHFSRPNTKLKISKNANQNIGNTNIKANSYSKSANFLNPFPLKKSKPVMINKNSLANVSIKKADNKPMKTGLSTLMCNYSTDDLSE